MVPSNPMFFKVGMFTICGLQLPGSDQNHITSHSKNSHISRFTVKRTLFQRSGAYNREDTLSGFNLMA